MLNSFAVHGGFDIVHAHGRIPSFVCDSLRGKTGFVPVVVTVHGIYDPAPPRRRLSKFGDRVIAVSADIKDDLINTYTDSSNGIITLRQQNIDDQMSKIQDEGDQLTDTYNANYDRYLEEYTNPLVEVYTMKASMAAFA